MKDLIVDLRLGREQGLETYCATLTFQIRALFKHRHTVRLNWFGWPVLTEFQ